VRDVGEQFRITVRVARHHGTEGYFLGGLGESGKQSPALEVLALRVTEQGIEVIPGVKDVCPQFFHPVRGVA
jgi:hypothetical protein